VVVDEVAKLGRAGTRLWRCFLCRGHEMNITCGLVRAGGAQHP